MVGKKKLVTCIFSFSHHVFYPFIGNFLFLSHTDFVIGFKLGKSEILSSRKFNFIVAF